MFADMTESDCYNRGVTLFNEAVSLSNAGKNRAAAEVCAQAIELLSAYTQNSKINLLYLRFHIFMGEEYEIVGSYNEAADVLSKAVELCNCFDTSRDAYVLELKAEAMMTLGKVSISQGYHMSARRHLRAADFAYEELLTKSSNRMIYRSRAGIAFLDAQVCSAQGLLRGAVYNYEKCIEYMEEYVKEGATPSDMHIIALASYLLGTMDRSTPDVPRLQKAFSIWNELVEKNGAQTYAQYRNEVSAILVKHMFK